MEKINGGRGAGQGLAGNARQPPALAADGHVKRLVALLTQLRDGDVLSDLDSGPDLHPDLLHDVDLGGDDILFKLV